MRCRPAPQDNDHRDEPGARSLRTQQRAYEPDHPTPTTFHARPKTSRTSGDHRGRPNWSAFHPRAPPQTLRGPPRLEDRPGLGAALHHTPGGMR